MCNPERTRDNLLYVARTLSLLMRPLGWKLIAA
jgi:hypothetical protein